MSKPDEVDTVQESLGNIQLEIENDVKSNQVFDADAMTQEQKDKVKSFRDQVAELKLDAKDLPDESAAIRFVSTNSFDVAAALEQYRAYLQWRKDHNVDSIATKELYQEDFLKALIPYSLHGFTKKGNPIYLEKTGKVHTWAAPQVDLDQFTWFHVRGVEQMLAKLKESSARHGRPIEKVSSIIDLAGLGLSHRNAISLLSTASALDAKYYPGLIGDIYVLNTPFVIPGLWEMVKMILPMSTITKIHILGSDYKERLLEHIDADQLPEEYGGTCKCPGGCIKEATEAEVKQVLLKDRSGLKLTEKTVLAGEKFEVKLDGKTGDEFLWSFDVSDNYDIGFSITMVQKDNPNAVVNVKMDSRCVTNKGSYNATKDCTLTFVWDNSYSYWNSKNLKYHCSVKSN